MTMRPFTAPSDAPARWTAVSIVGLAGVFVLAGCGSSPGPGTPTASTGSPDAQVKLFSDDFEGVCQGATVSKATVSKATVSKARRTSRRAPRTR